MRRLLDAMLPAATVAIVLALIYVPYVLSFNIRSHNFLVGDCFYYRAAVISLLEDRDLVLNNNIGDTNPLNGAMALGAAGRTDQVVPKHPVLLPLVSLPFYAAAGTVGLLGFNLLVIIGLMVTLQALAATWFDRWISAAVAVFYGVGTLFFHYVYNYSPDAFSTLVFLLGVLGVVRRRYGWGGLALGLSIFAKLPNAPLVAAVLAYAAVREWGAAAEDRRAALRPLLWLGGATLLGVLPFLAFNYALYGSPWVTGYHRAVTAAGLDDHVSKFNQPFLRGYLRLLLDPAFGLLPTNPVLLPALAGVWIAARHRARKPLLFLAGLAALQLAVFARYDEWFHSHYSNRFLMTAVALSAVHLTALLAALRARFAPAAGGVQLVLTPPVPARALAPENRTIQGLWIGGKLSLNEQLCLRSFLDFGHTFDLYAYDELRGVPAGVTVRDAAEILPRERIFAFPGGSYAIFADVFRWRLLHARGGWWSDMDVVCLRPFDLAEPLVVTSEPQDCGPATYTTAVLKTPAGHPLTAACVEALDRVDHAANRVWTLTNRQLLETELPRLGLEAAVQPPERFSPVFWGEAVPFFTDPAHAPRAAALLRNPRTYSLHLFNEFWRKHALDRNARFDRQSLIEVLRRRHGL